MYPSRAFVFSALFFVVQTIPTIQSSTSRGITIALELGNDEFKRSVVKGTAAYQNSIGEVHPFSGGINALAKRDPGNTGYVSLKYFYRARPLEQHLYGPITIGPQDSGTTFNALLDTGSPGLIVPLSKCEDVGCHEHQKYDPGLSPTSKGDFTCKFYDDSVMSGKLYADFVTIGGLTVTVQTFGAATKYPQSFANNPADGILGLSHPHLSYFNGLPIMESLNNDRNLKSPVFTLVFNRAEGHGLLYIGGILEGLYSGHMTWITVDTKSDLWSVLLYRIIVGPDKQEVEIGMFADLDTAASHSIIGDRWAIEELFNHIPHVRMGGNDGVRGLSLVYIPCNSVSITLIIEDEEMVIPADEFSIGATGDPRYPNLCIAGAAASKDIVEDETWIIGLNAFGKYLTAWNFTEGLHSFGFAERV